MIRVATKEDTEAVKELLKELATQTPYGRLFKDYTFPDEDIHRYMVSLKDMICIIVEEDAKPIGIGLFAIQPWSNVSVAVNISKIDYIYIKKEYRSKGYMDELLTAFEHWGKQVGANCYMLGVSKEDADLTKRGYYKSEVMYIKEVK